MITVIRNMRQILAQEKFKAFLQTLPQNQTKNFQKLKAFEQQQAILYYLQHGKLPATIKAKIS